MQYVNLPLSVRTDAINKGSKIIQNHICVACGRQFIKAMTQRQNRNAW